MRNNLIGITLIGLIVLFFHSLTLSTIGEDDVLILGLLRPPQVLIISLGSLVIMFCGILINDEIKSIQNKIYKLLDNHIDRIDKIIDENKSEGMAMPKADNYESLVIKLTNELKNNIEKESDKSFNKNFLLAFIFFILSTIVSLFSQ